MGGVPDASLAPTSYDSKVCVLVRSHSGWRLSELSEKGGGQRIELGKGKSEDLETGRRRY